MYGMVVVGNESELPEGGKASGKENFLLYTAAAKSEYAAFGQIFVAVAGDGA